MGSHPVRCSPAARARAGARRSRRVSRRAAHAECACGGSRWPRVGPRRCEPASDHEPAVTGIEETQKLLDFRKRMQLGGGALPRLRQIELRFEEESICALQLAAHVLWKTMALQA